MMETIKNNCSYTWGSTLPSIDPKIVLSTNMGDISTVLTKATTEFKLNTKEEPKEENKPKKENKMQSKPSTTIKSITINKDKRIVTVVFNDNSVRMSKCTKDDTFDVNVGVAMCIAYQLFNGSKSAFKKEVTRKSKETKVKNKEAK